MIRHCRSAPAAPPLSPDADIRPMADIEREAIQHAIEKCGGKVRKAAELLGISAPTIYRKKAVWDETGNA